MHSIQPHGIDPVIPSYHLLPKGEGNPIHTPWRIDWQEPLQKCYPTLKYYFILYIYAYGAELSVCYTSGYCEWGPFTVDFRHIQVVFVILVSCENTSTVRFSFKSINLYADIKASFSRAWLWLLSTLISNKLPPWAEEHCSFNLRTTICICLNIAESKGRVPKKKTYRVHQKKCYIAILA